VLPAEVEFTEAEVAAWRERIDALDKKPSPRFPTISIAIWILAASGWSYLAFVQHSRVEWVLAALAIGAAVEAIIRYRTRKGKHAHQREAA
jgi:hypothetical protein